VNEVVFHRLSVLPVVDHPDEIACARDGCGDGYGRHAVDGELGACTICLCPGFLWVPERQR
jgi:hypothetical protein